ncbi:helix-turn-helix domain-containing protein [Lactobacillus ultunensis]|uniref:Transcriptional regulator, AraC family n=1 Tax=Lactobacillus ultunensis DSM 16047 TaxID=525365 RepID=C2ELJ2_9LACO|nr:helix-turn-helix domain-containing protein [Lactobacillus ultunensis]EEJ72640.1 transcriptional regulator, AraC family [Lactobacillus ultunensis DSM 16047]KRL81220.1 AraC family transcriptional regulator [Lactobacillus ultunensis DSM 16047]QQP28166.1 helix-turn-helix domain-containing protein [Lactobacillus ultunensis]
MLIENGKIGEINFYNRGQNYVLSENLHIIYNLNDPIRIKFSTSDFELEKTDLIMIPVNGNANIFCSSPQSIYLDVNLNKNFLENFVRKGQIISCTPKSIGQKSYKELVFLLNKLCSSFIGQNQIELERILFEIVITIKTGFVSDLSSLESPLKIKIKNFVQQNFTENITLEKTAQELNITPQYLSNYFKDHFRTTYIHYLNELRLDKSIQLLNDSNYKIVNVAFDSGFNSVSTFNRLFKNRYGISPLVWRKKNNINKDELKDINQEIIKRANEENKREEIQISPNYNKISEKKIKIIHVGLDALDNDNALRSFESLKVNTLMFDFDYEKGDIQNYIRQIENKIGKFIKEDIDIVVQLNLNASSSIEGITKNLNYLFEYFANLISINRVRKWGICFSGLSNFSLTQINTLCQRIENKILNRLKIHGPIFYRGNYQDLEKIIDLPLTKNKILLLDVFVKKMNIDTFSYYLKKLRNKFDGPIFLENLTFFRANYKLLNDTEIRAKSFLELMLRNYDEIDGVVINNLIDIGNHMNEVLSGDNGIETKEWLPKPIYHALCFLNIQGKYILSIKDNYIISWNGENDYSVLMLCPSTFTRHEFKLTYDNYLQLIKQEQHKFDLQFGALKSGKYKLKIRKINSTVGNIIEGYKDLDYSENLSLDEFMYLKNRVQPEMMIKKYLVDKGLDLFFDLKQDDIIFAHLIYLY